jgi:hypothetical protein
MERDSEYIMLAFVFLMIPLSAGLGVQADDSALKTRVEYAAKIEASADPTPVLKTPAHTCRLP